MIAVMLTMHPATCYRRFVRRDKKAWKWNPPKDNKKRDVSGREGGASVSAAMFCAGYTLPSIQYCSECVSSVWCYWFYHEIRVFLPPLFTPDEDYTNVSALVLYFGWVITLFQANMSTSNVKHQNTIRFVNKKLESIYLDLDKLINPIYGSYSLLIMDDMKVIFAQVWALVSCGQ